MAKVSRSRIAQVITERLDATTNVEKLSREVAAYLLETGRSSELESVLRDVMQLRAEQGIVEVIAHSARPLSDKTKADITAEAKTVYPRAKSIIISQALDDQLIGGVRLEFANQQLDLTIRATLNRFKQLTTA